jgi:glycosyltransferase involved in cell wall biosynthesis
MKQKIALVVPMFNEELRFSSDYWQLLVENETIHLYFVDDGSTDSTAILLRNFCNKLNTNLSSNRVHLLTLGNNSGKAKAIRFGFTYIFNTDIPFRTVAFLDGDQAFSAIEVLEKLAKYRHELPCKVSNAKCSQNFYWSSRVALAGSNIERNLIRHYINRILLTVLCWNLPNAPYDSQAGFKIFPACQHVRQLFSEPFKTKWLFDFEIFLRVNGLDTFFTKDAGVFEFPIKEWRDVPGSKLNSKQTVTILREIYYVLKTKRAKAIPAALD